MSNKRRRPTGNKSGSSGSRGGARPAPRTGSGSRTRAAGTGASRTSTAKQRRAAPAASRGRGADKRPARERIFPPDGAAGIGFSFVLGLRSTISSVPLVGLCLVGPLVLWCVMAALKAPPVPQAMNEALSLPPIHSILAVVSLPFAAQGSGGQVTALLAFGFQILFYAAFMTLAISLARSAQDAEATAVALRRAWSVLKARLPWMIVVELGFVSIALILVFFLPLVLGGFAIPVGLMAVIYFTVFVAPAVVLARMTGRDALRASIAVARMVRTNHAVLVGGYVLFAIVILWEPGRAGTVTPTVGVWLYALVAGLLHVSMLSVFVHRWRVLSPAVVPPALTREGEPALETT